MNVKDHFCLSRHLLSSIALHPRRHSKTGNVYIFVIANIQVSHLKFLELSVLWEKTSKNPKSIPCSGAKKLCKIMYRIVSYRIVLYCIVLETKTTFMLYLFNQMILLSHFSSTTFVLKNFKFSITAISLS